MRYSVLLLSLVLLLACGIGQQGPYRIKLVILGKMKASEVQAVRQQFAGLFPGKQIVVDTVHVSMPEKAYYQPRNRYRAEKVLQFLRLQKGEYDYIAAITALPISTEAHGHKDYGICGLSYTGNDVSVTSSYHLDEEMFLQTVRHEWGHSVPGLPHCKHKNCIMNAANGKAENLRGHSQFKDGCKEKFNQFYTNLE